LLACDGDFWIGREQKDEKAWESNSSIPDHAANQGAMIHHMWQP
jgi:hypothetical protein